MPSIATSASIFVEELIARNAREHPDYTFLAADLTRDPLPKSDLILCRDCLVHFSFADIRAALDNFNAAAPNTC